MTVTYTTWVASQSYGSMRALMAECAVGVHAPLPRPQNKRALEGTVRRWLIEADKPKSDRKRNRGEATAGQRLRTRLGYRGIEI